MPTPKTKLPIATPPPPFPQRLIGGVKLGLNLFDVMKMNPYLRKTVLRDKEGRPHIDLSKAVRLNPEQPEDTLVVFLCDTMASALIVDIVRNDNRIEGTEPCRSYIDRGKGWVRLSPSAILTITEDGKPILNPDLFPVKIELAPLIAPVPKRVEFGRK